MMMKQRIYFRPRSRALALEPRVLFDAAAAVATEDHWADKSLETQASTPSSADERAYTPTEAAQPTVVLIIDARVADYQSLLTDLPSNVLVRVVQADESGLDAITQAVSGLSGVESIQIISHGSSGTVALGSDTLDANTLSTRSTQVQGWASHLSADADILLFGCDVATGLAGDALLTELALLTSADIAASTNLTGSTALGGDWVLETQTGQIESRTVLSEAALRAYTGVLDTYTTAPTVSTPSDQTGTEDVAFGFGSIVQVTSGGTDRMEAEVKVTSGNGTVSDGEVAFTQLASQGSVAGINAFLSSLKFEGAANFNGAVTITVTITNDFNNRSTSNTTTRTFILNLTAVADAPTTGTVTALASVAEDTSNPSGATLSSLLTGFSDVDGNTLAGIAISGNTLNASQGAWQYSVNGSTWTDVGSVSASSALLLGKDTLVRFVPASNWFGTPTSLTLRAIDSSTSRSFSTTGTRVTGALSASTTDIAATDATLGTSVTPVNDAPVTADRSLSGSKNQTLTFSLTSTDADTGTNTSTDAVVTQYRIVTVPTDGVLKTSTGTVISAGDLITVAQATGMTFTPTTNFIGAPTFSYQAVDAANVSSTASTVTLTVAQFNEPPVLTVPGAKTVLEDGTLSVTGVALTDADAGSSTTQLTLSAVHGSLSFASLTGLTVTAGANGSHSVTVQGTLAALNAALDSSNLSYSPDADYPNSTVAASDTITLVVNDLGSNTGVAAKTSTRTIAVTVTPVADAPVILSAITLPAVNEDTLSPAGAAVSSVLAGQFSDADGNTLAGIAISANPQDAAQGTWQYSLNAGQIWVDVGNVTAASALLLNGNAYLRFVPAANYYGEPAALTVYALDNSGSRVFTTSTASRQTADVTVSATDLSVSGQSLGTSITSVNDEMTVVVDKPLTVAEGNTVLLTDSALKITDVEASAAQIVYTVLASGTNLAEGTLQLDSAHDGSWATTLTTGSTFTQDDINNGRIRYVHAGDEPTTAQTLAYSVTDLTATGGGTTLTRSLSIQVSPVNDVPVLTLNAGAVAAIGGSLTFSTAQLLVTDPDNTAEQLVFRIDSLPTHGELTLNGAGVAVGSVFNSLQISQLVYKHDGTLNLTDTFTVSLRDGAGGVLTSQTVNLTIGPDNKAPTGIGNLTSDMYEDPAAAGLSNPGRAINSYTGYSFSDSDVGATVGGIAIVGNPQNAAQGEWQYSADAGTTWSAIGAVNDTGSALVLAPTTLVRFVPATNYNGTPTGLTLRAMDNTYSAGVSTHVAGFENRVTVDTTLRGSVTAISANTNTLGIEVIAVDDDPTLTHNSASAPLSSFTPVADSSVPSLVLTGAMLQVSDVDSPASSLTYTLVSQPAHGYMARLQNGVWTQLENGANFTQADITAGSVRYFFTGNATTNTSDQFNFKVTDGAVRILPTERPGGIYADATDPTLSTLTFTLTITDPPPDATGTPYTPPTTPTGANGAPDGITMSAPITLDEGATVTLTTTMLTASDTDTAATALTYVIVTRPTSGNVRLNGAVLGIGGSFTQDDLANGRVTFSHDGDEDFVDEFRFYVTDGNTVTAVTTALIEVTPVNDQPQIKTVDSVDVLEGGAVVLTGGALTLSPSQSLTLPTGMDIGLRDVDGVNDDKNLDPDSLTLSLTTALLHGKLQITSNGTDWTDLGAGASFTQAQLNAGQVRYLHDGSETTTDTLALTVNDNNATNTASLIIRVIPVNDDPVVTVNSGPVTPAASEVSFVLNEGATRTITATELSSSDPDNTDTQVQFRITANVTHGKLFRGTEVLGVGSAITQKDLDDGLITYVHDGLESTADQFSYTLSDGGGGTEPAGVFLITLTQVDDAPVINLTTPRLAVEDQSLNLDDISISDPDSVALDGSIDTTYGDYTVTVTAANGSLSQTTFTGTLGAVNTALATLVYTGNANFNGTDTVTLQVNDGTTTTTRLLELTVRSVNDAPVATVPSAQTVSEDTPLTFNTAGGNTLTVNDTKDTTQAGATDSLTAVVSVNFGTLTAITTGGAVVTANGTASVTLTGTQAQIDAALDGLVYQAALNYHGNDTLTLAVSDQGHTGVFGSNLTDTQTVAITVTPVNDAPTTAVRSFTVNEDTTLSFALASADVDSNTSASTDAVVDRYRIDTLPSYGTLQYLDGSTWTALTVGQVITKAQGEALRFVPDADFNSTQGTVTFNYTALDAADVASNPSAVNITVSAVNDTPVLTGAGDSVSFAENSSGVTDPGGWVRLDASGDFALVRDTELTEQTTPVVDTFNSSTLTVQRQGTAVSTDRFQLDTTYTGDGKTVAVSGDGSVGSTVSVGGTVVGSITTNSGGSFVVTFNASADKAAVSAVMTRLQFNSVANNLLASSPLTLAATFNDGNAVSTQGSGGALSATGTFTVNVTNVNDAPSFTADGLITVAEDTASPAGATISSLMGSSFSDPDAGIATGGSFAGIAIVSNTSNATTQGSWQYSVNGTDWLDVGAVSTTNALLLTEATQLRFVPVTDFNDQSSGASNPAPGLGVYAVDNSNNTGRVFSTQPAAVYADTVTGWTDSSDMGADVGDGKVINVSVTQVNDAPVIGALDGDNAGFQEAVGVNVAGTAVLLDVGGNATLADIDLVLRGETTFNGATLSVQQASVFHGALGSPDTTDFYVVQVGSGITVSGGYSEPGSGLKLFNNGSLIRYNGITVATLTDNSDVSGKLTITFNANATQAAVEAILHNLAFSSNNDALVSSSKTIRITFTDGNGSSNNSQGTGGALSATADVTMTLTPTNDSPTFTAGATLTTLEDTTTTATTLGALLGSQFVDSDGVSSLTGVAISAATDGGAGHWEVNLGGSAGWESLSTFGTPSTASALLLSASTQIQFVPNADVNSSTLATAPSLSVHAVEGDIPAGAPGANAPVISFTTSSASPVTYNTTTDTAESRVAAESVVVAVSITARNDAPVLSGTTFSGVLNEATVTGVGTDKQALLTAVSVSDIDLSTNAALASGVFGAGTITVALTGGVTGDRMTVEGSPAGVASTSGGADGANLVITLSTGATVAQVQAILEAINYQHLTDTPPTTARTYTVTLNDGNNRDAQGDTAGGLTALNAATVLTGSITIDAGNDAPTLSGVGSASYTENASGAVLFSGLVVADADDTQLVSAVISIGTGFTAGDTLNFATQNGISGSYNSTTGVLNLSGTASVAEYQAALRSITFSSSSEDPTVNASATTRTLSWRVTDANSDGMGAATSVDKTSTLTITPAQDKPVMSAGGSQSYTENAAAVIVDSGVSVVSDADDTQMASAQVSIASAVSGDTLAFTAQHGITGSYSAGVLSLSGVATLAQYQDVLRSVTYASTSDDPTVNNTRTTRSVSWTVTDANSDNAGAATSVAVTSTLNLTAVNDAPVVGALAPVSYTENAVGVAIGGAITLSDADDTQLVGASISISANKQTGDLLAFTNQNGISGSYDSGIGVLTLTGTASVAQYQTALQSITFSSSSDDPTVNATATTRTLSWSVTDANSDAAGAQTSSVVSNTLTITPQQDAPVITPVGALAYTENAGATVVDAAITVADADDTQITGGSIALSTHFLAGDVLAVVNQGAITGSYNASTGVLTLTGTDTLANYQSVLRSLSYLNSTDDPTDNTSKTTRVLTYSLNDANSDAAGVATGTATKTINLTPTQDAPVMSGGGATLAYTEQALASVIDASVVVASDADDTQMSGATITLSAGYTAGDVLGFTTQNGITISSNSAGVLVLTGNATLAQYTTALQSVTFSSTSDDPTASSASRTVSWVVRDANSDAAGTASSNTLSSTINITAVNDTPVAVADIGTTSENVTLIKNAANGVLSNDTDLDSTDTHTVSEVNGVAGNVATGVAGTHGGTFTVATDGSYSFNPGSAFDDLAVGESRTTSVTYTNRDSNGGTATATLTITVTGTNDAPSIIGSAISATIAETNATHLSTTGALTLGDLDTSNTVTTDVAQVVVSGNGNHSGLALDNAALKALFSVTGALTSSQTSAPLNWAFDSGSNTFDYLAVGENLVLSYTVRAIDSNNPAASTDQVVTITVTGTNDAPVISLGAGDSDAAALIESNATLSVSDTLSVTDLDYTNTVSVATTSVAASGVTSGLGSDNAALLAMLSVDAGNVIANNATTGTINWAFGSGSEHFDYLGAGEVLTLSYNVRATDSSSATTNQTVTITITGTNDAPVAVLDTGTTSENVTLVKNAANGVLSNDTDLDSTDTHTVSAVNGVAGNVATGVAGTQGGTFTVAPDGSYSFNPGSVFDDLAVGESRTTQVNYTNKDSQGATASSTLTITVTGTNDAPVAVLDTGTTSENVTLVKNAANGVLSNDTDLDSTDTHTVSEVNGVAGNVGADVTGSNGGTFKVAANGSYSFDPGTAFDDLAAGESRTTSVTYTNKDSQGATASSTLTITVTGTNDGPVAVPDTNTTVENTPVTVDALHGVLSNDTDLDTSDTHTVSEVNGVAGNVATGVAGTHGGTFNVAANGSYSFDPGTAFDDLAAGESRTTSVTYTNKDSQGATATATLTITVTGYNDAPVAVDDTGYSPDGRAVTLDVVANDTDLEPGPLHVSKIAGVAVTAGSVVTLPQGTVTLNADGTLTFAPNPGVQGYVDFAYEVSDQYGGTDTANVSVKVVPAGLVTPMTSTTALLPLVATLTGLDQAREPSVFFDGATFNGVVRLPIPFHPIVFVSNVVAQVQTERAARDQPGLSDPSAVNHGEIQSQSIGAGLGVDPALFVQSAVRASIQRADFLDDLVNGRLSRINLSSERMIATPDLFEVEVEVTESPLTEPLVAAPVEPARADSVGQEADPREPVAQAPTPARRAAPSFSEQLRSAGSRSASLTPGAKRLPATI